MEQKYNDKMKSVGFDQLVCDIFLNWEDVKDEILLPDRKVGSGNGTVHVFLGAADAELRKEFSSYYTAVENGEDTVTHAIKIKHFFLKSNVLSMLGYVCQYCKSKGKDFNSIVSSILKQLDSVPNQDGLISTESLFKLSIGSNKLRPYFKQFDEKGIFHRIIRQLLLPESAYKVSLYKNSSKEYAAFWLIGFDDLNDFEADSTKSYIEQPVKKIPEEETEHLQQIFYGAPGTGKSYKINEITQHEDVIRTTFHPDTDYSTFVGAYKPTTIEEDVMTVIGTKAVPVENPDGSLRKESKIVYEFVQQAFLRAYISAWIKYAKATDGIPQKQYLVIEEINRGNCAQIFGDLFQLLDRNVKGFSDYPVTADADMKRQLKKALQGLTVKNAEDINSLYHGRNICKEVMEGDILLLPNNLYIWATMNTSDQSLFPIDSAFKRRWDWIYRPISDAGTGWLVNVDGNLYDWWKFVEKINEKIGSTTNSEDKKLGYFFCKASDGIISAETFVGKVVFYLWNDVFKDYEFGDSIFDDGHGGKLTFDKFYTVVAGVTKVVEENVILFMNNLGLEPIQMDDEEYTGQSESVESSEAEKLNWSLIQTKRYEFWNAFLDYAQQNTEFTKYFGGVKRASKDHWKNFFIPGVDFYLVALQQRKKNAAEVQVYFDKTTDTYHRLFAHKKEIEQEMGVNYEWKELPDKKSSIISERKLGVNFDNSDEWKSLFDFYIDRLLRMREVFTKYANNNN